MGGVGGAIFRASNPLMPNVRAVFRFLAVSRSCSLPGLCFVTNSIFTDGISRRSHEGESV